MTSYLDWKVGDKVVCLDNRRFEHNLELGGVYTISSVEIGSTGYLYIGLAEVINWKSGRPGLYRVHRFRRVQPRKTSIAIFEAMLHGSKQEVGA